MPEQELASRGRALDQAFYPEPTWSLRDELSRREQKVVEALKEASPIRDLSILNRLAALGIRPETLAALIMAPIVEVAWADGKMSRKEREAILQAAESAGIEAGSPSHGLLEIWTRFPPGPELHRAWSDFIAAFMADLAPDERAKIRQELVPRARAVAEAAGGILGIGSISQHERAVLESLEEAFA